MSGKRIDVVDALRGSALFGILLLHAVEHWDLIRMPEHRPGWQVMLDQQVLDAAYAIFGGKAYAIFALVFGVSFFITLDRWSRTSRNASARFVWRLVLLGGLGYLHGLLYGGDVLMVIAVLGLPLVLLNKLPTRALLVVAVALLLQLPEWPGVFQVLSDPSFTSARPHHWDLYGQTDGVYAAGSFAEVVRLNAWTGQAAKWWWTIETFRYPQMLGLFVCGLLIGRSGVLLDAPKLRQVALRALIAGIVGWGLTWFAQRGVQGLGLKDGRLMVISNLVNAYGNLAQMAVWAGGFTLLYVGTRAARALGIFAPYGRMSLTCYVTQAALGVPFFYGFGLAMFRSVGPFHALFFALGVFALQLAFAHWWLRRYTQGPLEWLWRAATLGTLQLPLLRERFC
ncbi:DUF418 domain-containing protein [Roseateles sp.]|uniref:DUF418 domain-containing protein n=1 Tax=Roseateles sp. TaxID=1971397 RepID=UPI003267873E